jgi:hypothetical protein
MSSSCQVLLAPLVCILVIRMITACLRWLKNIWWRFFYYYWRCDSYKLPFNSWHWLIFRSITRGFFIAYWVPAKLKLPTAAGISSANETSHFYLISSKCCVVSPYLATQSTDILMFDNSLYSNNNELLFMLFCLLMVLVMTWSVCMISLSCSQKIPRGPLFFLQ